jgi:hypothetical protein
MDEALGEQQIQPATEVLGDDNLWVSWLAATIAAGLAGGVGMLATFGAAGIIGLFFSFLIMSIFVGVMQEVVLRRYLTGLAPGKWALMSALGGLLGFLFGSIVGSAGYTGEGITTELLLSALIAGIFCALPLGIAQAFVLRPYVPVRPDGMRNIMWVVNSSIGWGLGMVAAVVFLVITNPGASRHDYASGEVLNPLAAWLLAVMVYGVATAPVLPRLDRRPPERAPSGETTPLTASRGRPGMVLFYIVSVGWGLLWLWAGYGLLETVFGWPEGYYGPGTPSGGPPSDDFYTLGRVLAIGLVGSSVLHLLLTTYALVRAVRSPAQLQANPWTRFWGIALLSFVFLLILNIWAFLAWFVRYTD